MHLPALRNSVPATIGNQSLEDFIRNSVKNLQRVSEHVPSGGASRPAYLTFDGTTGIFRLDKEVVDPKSLGKILVSHDGIFEGCIEWANSSPLQKIMRSMLGVDYEEAMSEKLLPKPLSPQAYRKATDGPTMVLGFVGCLLDDATNISFEHRSGGAKTAVRNMGALATQALTVFGEMVHPVIELGANSYVNREGKTIYNPKFNPVGFVADTRVKEIADISEIAKDDILTRPMPSRARVRREAQEGPAI
jgi:hypothetical protein